MHGLERCWVGLRVVMGDVMEEIRLIGDLVKVQDFTLVLMYYGCGKENLLLLMMMRRSIDSSNGTLFL